MSAAPLLAVQGLAAAYGGVLAVHDVSFDVRAGEIVAIVGGNGAGKTTTHRAYVMQDGRIVLSGDAQEIRNDPEVKRRFLGEA